MGSPSSASGLEIQRSISSGGPWLLHLLPPCFSIEANHKRLVLTCPFQHVVGVTRTSRLSQHIVFGVCLQSVAELRSQGVRACGSVPKDHFQLPETISISLLPEGLRLCFGS